jgi:hypothetical protein
MTEAEWQAAGDPQAMLRFLHWQHRRNGNWRQRLFGWLGNKIVTISQRKTLLLLLAYCRCHSHLSADERDKSAFRIAEAYADGNASEQELRSATTACMTWEEGMGYPSPGYWLTDVCRQPFYEMGERSYLDFVLSWIASASAVNFTDFMHGVSLPELWPLELEMEGYFAAEAQRMVHLLHETIGNPFRPVTINPSWLTSTVLALAEGIYADRAFDRMPILADALQDAGCDNADVLKHCREPREHVRGCWVVDLLTERG